MYDQKALNLFIFLLPLAICYRNNLIQIESNITSFNLQNKLQFYSFIHLYVSSTLIKDIKKYNRLTKTSKNQRKGIYITYWMGYFLVL